MGAAPVIPIIRPTVDQAVCGNSIVDKSIKLSGTRIGGAVVWVTDIRSGKAFPLERRYELNNANCTLDPYVQAISTGGTLNVGNADRLVHTNRFINVGTGKIAGIAPFNDDGELVPVDRFDESAEIEVVSDKHPWTRAWIAVLDHPYYAQTAANGTFTIDAHSSRQISRPCLASSDRIHRRQRDCSRGPAGGCRIANPPDGKTDSCPTASSDRQRARCSSHAGSAEHAGANDHSELVEHAEDDRAASAQQ